MNELFLKPPPCLASIISYIRLLILIIIARLFIESIHGLSYTNSSIELYFIQIFRVLLFLFRHCSNHSRKRVPEKILLINSKSLLMTS